jgi:hypothetical protein
MCRHCSTKHGNDTNPTSGRQTLHQHQTLKCRAKLQEVTIMAPHRQIVDSNNVVIKSTCTSTPLAPQHSPDNKEAASVSG